MDGCPVVSPRSAHFEQLWCHPTTQLPVIDKHVEEMLVHDIIKPAVPPWCSNMLMVKKWDCTMCFCIDYRKANDLIKKDRFSFRFLDTLNGCCYFSSWPDLLGTIALAYNLTIHSATGYSPHELFFLSSRPALCMRK